MIRGVIFDLDGTLIDSRLDFDLMRREIGLPEGTPILEALAEMEPAEARRAWTIVQQHELAGARRAEIVPGVMGFLRRLQARSIRCAVLTRNSRAMAQVSLKKIDFPFSPVLTRDDGPIKPDPWAVRRIAEHWRLPLQEILFVGDSIFDMETARRAGVLAVMYTAGRDPAATPGVESADVVFHSFADCLTLFTHMTKLN